MLIAVTRPVSSSLARCELTHRPREPIDVALAVTQHAEYERVLASLGAAIVRVPEAADLPDAVFVEDTALVLDEVAIMTRPGAASRRSEGDAVAAVLRAYRSIEQIHSPGTIDGGDVLRIGQTLYVGLSSRTNHEGIRQLGALVSPFGYQVIVVEVTGCLHLKSAVTEVGGGLVLLNPEWISPGVFGGREYLEVDPAEPGGANALRIGAALVYPTHFPRTANRLRESGLRVMAVECGELAKAEAGVTCCSLLFVAIDLTADPEQLRQANLTFLKG